VVSALLFTFYIDIFIRYNQNVVRHKIDCFQNNNNFKS
jgi:hypothetical protein